MLRCVLLASAAVFSLPAFAQSQLPPVELDEISVSANLTPTPTKEVASAVTIITGDELQQRQIRLVSDALRSVPGVAVNRTGGPGGLTQVRLRGSEGNHTLVTIDGIEVNDPGGGSEFNFAHLLVQDIDRIEVLRGPQSSLYGSDAIGGVVNIVSKRGEGPARLAGYIEGGNRGTAAGGVTLSGSTDRVDYLFSGAGLRTDGFSSAAEARGWDEKDGYENASGFAKVGFQATDYLRFDFVGRGTSYFAEGDDEPPGGAVDFVSDLDGETFFGRAQAKLDLFDGAWQQIFGASTLSHNREFYYDTFPPSTIDGEKTKFDYRSNFFHTSGEFDHTVSFLAEREDEHVEQFGTFDEEVGQTGIAGEYKLGVWDSLFFTGSARHDFNEGFADATTYKLSAAYFFEQTGTKIRTSYGTGVKNPTLIELFGTFPGFVPNPNLEPESAEGWDVGLDQTLFDGRMSFDLTYFDQTISDLIQSQGNTVVNLPGESEIHGVELGVSVRPVDDLTMRASFTWQDAQGPEGEELIRRPEFLGSFDLDYVFYDGRANAGFSVIYNGAQYDLPYWNPLVELEDFVLVNIRAGYKITENAELYGRVENLLDEEYEEIYTYGGAGRLAIVGMRASF
ncbi:TonB-dependent receptor [Terrihabitans soli]|uniref:TonB-dependent receptor n=1 Tax=Terrihabitans soli TaxID=708113 RepID=A0A6S6QXK6_9HYPH|nr:TonB-dependent receptor [Terrihabitans soli]BCJ92265.1 TonB-dependent receptor [Terrihabitans soli]